MFVFSSLAWGMGGELIYIKTCSTPKYFSHDRSQEPRVFVRVVWFIILVHNYVFELSMASLNTEGCTHFLGGIKALEMVILVLGFHSLMKLSLLHFKLDTKSEVHGFKFQHVDFFFLCKSTYHIIWISHHRNINWS